MAGPGLRDLIGRLMVDKDFLAALVRDPIPILADYDLAAEERSLIIEAASRASQAPEPDRARSLQAGLIKRWAT